MVQATQQQASANSFSLKIRMHSQLQELYLIGHTTKYRESNRLAVDLGNQLQATSNRELCIKLTSRPRSYHTLSGYVQNHYQVGSGH
jgi:hypothetical protein